MPNQKEQENWEIRIRQILVNVMVKDRPRQIINYICLLLKAERQKAYQDGYEKGLFLRKEYNDPKLIAKICSTKIQKAREETIKEIENDIWQIFPEKYHPKRDELLAIVNLKLKKE